MKNDFKEKNKRVAYVVSHTHWDREWRYPIWETRQMLVDFMDELIQLLESNCYPGFLMDGQVIPVLDYLDTRPEMTNRVKQLVGAGKLEIGPWFTLPDEFPVDGEALVRNLLLGNRKAKELGAVFNEGYTSFGWGQTAQLPQIYAGFGMEIAIIGKRVSKERAPESEFIWRAPDGSSLLTTRLGGWGRQNFYFKIHLSALFNIDHEGFDWRYDWCNGGCIFHRADYPQMEQDYQRLDAPDKWYPEYITPEVIEKTWHTTDESVLANDRLMMNGCDYTASQPRIPEMLECIKERDSDQTRKWIHTTMSEYVKVMKRKIDRSKLRTVEGELRDGPAVLMTGNALSTRLYIKRLNKQAQNMLIRTAEPLAVIAAMAGAVYPKEFLEKAWEYLLKAHPHDSINGVTQDKTARDTLARLDQVIELSEVVSNRAMQELVRRIDTREFGDDDVLLIVFNSLPYPRRHIIEAWVDIPKSAHKELMPNLVNRGLQIFDADGNMVDTQWQGFDQKISPVAEIHTRAFPFESERHRVFLDTKEVPAGGYKVFRVGSLDERTGESVVWQDLQSRKSTLRKSPNLLENEFLKVSMNINGTFDIVDKRIGKTFSSLNYYEDRGEHGDYWANKPPMFDQIHTSLGCTARIWSEDFGPLQATLVNEITMQLPQHGDKERQRRGRKLEDLTIRTSVSLRAHSEQVEVNVCFENYHEDHYLRVLFPTGLQMATCADVGGHFTVDHRSIKPQGPTPASIWPDMATLPQNNFVDISDGKIGIAFLNDSLTEYEVFDDDQRTVALSLLRAVRNAIPTELRVWSDFPSQGGGQSQGYHLIRYAIMPHAGDWKKANVPLAAELFNVRPLVVQTRANKGLLPPKHASLFEIDNLALRFSTLKSTEDRDTFIVRIYNPTEEVQKGKIQFFAPLSEAWETNLNEERIGKLNLTKENTVEITTASQKIVTIEIKPKSTN